MSNTNIKTTFTKEQMDKSYRWLFKTRLYKNSVDYAIKRGMVKTKTEYATQLWLVYLSEEAFSYNARTPNEAFSWMRSPQGYEFWLPFFTCKDVA
jgi:hypothetical protein